MKNIIPFKKDVIFKTNIGEITSISLENTLNLEDDKISGDFIISGEYKVTDSSNIIDPFEIKLPFEVVLDDRFDSNSATVDIDDFYYEIINDNVLSVSIDVLVDHLKEKPIVELDDLTEVEPVEDTIKEDNMINDIFKDESEDIREEKEEDKTDNIENKVNSLFSGNNFDSDVYVTYNVFILREGDTLDAVIEKYNTTMDELKKYNDLSNLKLGDKLIIPALYEGN